MAFTPGQVALYSQIVSGSATNANATVASATGTAHNASVAIAPNAGNSSGTGAGQQPSDTVAPSAAVASGTGTGQNATASAAGQIILLPISGPPTTGYDTLAPITGYHMLEVSLVP